MQTLRFRIQKVMFGGRGIFVLFFLVYLMIGATLSYSQSTDQNFPTPVTANEISGIIKARDIGDSRLTNYFYSFNGTQGDIFINVQTTNFSGDIDVFTVEGLKLLTKVTIYADLSDNETGRVVYLRKPEKLLLRIEGRSPNDDAATFRIKFAGSFAAVTDAERIEAPAAPVVRSENDSDVIVNSVGTIIGTKPKPVPSPKATPEPSPETVNEIAVVKNDKKTVVAENKKSKKSNSTDSEKPETATPDTPVTGDTSGDEIEKSSNEVAKNDNKPARKKTSPAPGKKPVKKTEEDQPADNNAEKDEAAEKEKAAQAKAEKNKRAKREESREEDKAAKREEIKEKNKEAELTAALANITLKILFKDGTKIERPMSEVLKVGVDKGILTVITKDGAIGRYSVLDLTKFTIE